MCVCVCVCAGQDCCFFWGGGGLGDAGRRWKKSGSQALLHVCGGGAGQSWEGFPPHNSSIALYLLNRPEEQGEERMCIHDIERHTGGYTDIRTIQI